MSRSGTRAPERLADVDPAREPTSAAAIAVDLGSSSGRVIVGELNGLALTLTEVHRFAHQARQSQTALHWDEELLWEGIITGLRRARALLPASRPATVSIDTWGVDYAVLDKTGIRLTPLYSYRDERTNHTETAFTTALPPELAFSETGIQPQVINTANQLFAQLATTPELREDIDQVLFLPDYFSWRLTGVPAWSRSIISTAGLANIGAESWSPLVFSALGLDPDWFGPPTAELTVAGPVRPEFDLGPLQVVRGGAHDTACAVHAIPANPVGEIFISCGSWSVLGTVGETPLLSPTAQTAGITNELCTDGRFRSQRNLTGLWILQECWRQWAADTHPPDLVELLQAAAQAPSIGLVIDTEDPSLALPGEMPSKILRLAQAAGLTRDLEKAELVRLVLESLAFTYRQAVTQLRQLMGAQPSRCFLFGGGARNDLLCQLTASALEMEVVTGSAEASTLGSILAQFQTTGALNPAQARQVATASAFSRRYQPKEMVAWDKLTKGYQK